MASSLSPKIRTYQADAAIAKGKAVKIGASSDEYVQVAAAASDKLLGLAQSAATAADDAVEVAMGGGAKGLAQTAIAAGEFLTAHTDGTLKPASSGEYYIAQAMQAAVAGDLFDVNVVAGIY